MQGTQAHLKFFPERHTDFAFSVFAEEHGFWGAALVFSLFAFLILNSPRYCTKLQRHILGMLAVGIAFFIFWEFVINVAMVLGVFPVVGLPSPFFSYGSSLLLTVCVALGLWYRLIAIDTVWQKTKCGGQGESTSHDVLNEISSSSNGDEAIQKSSYHGMTDAQSPLYRPRISPIPR